MTEHPHRWMHVAQDGNAHPVGDCKRCRYDLQSGMAEVEFVAPRTDGEGEEGEHDAQ